MRYPPTKPFESPPRVNDSGPPMTGVPVAVVVRVQIKTSAATRKPESGSVQLKGSLNLYEMQLSSASSSSDSALAAFANAASSPITTRHHWNGDFIASSPRFAVSSLRNFHVLCATCTITTAVLIGMRGNFATTGTAAGDKESKP